MKLSRMKLIIILNEAFLYGKNNTSDFKWKNEYRNKIINSVKE